MSVGCVRAREQFGQGWITFRLQRPRWLRGGCGVLADVAAARSVDGDRDVADEGVAVHDARLVVVFFDRTVLSSAVVPHRHVTQLPIPSNGVLGLGDSAL